MTGRVLTATFPATGWAIPKSTVSAGRYLLRFARTEADLERVLGLRAGGGGGDEDDFDSVMHHLIVEERETGTIAGTCRMQTAEMAAESGRGYASAKLFDLTELPDSIQKSAVEFGRICRAEGHRTPRVSQLLWRGVATYLNWNRKRVILGCCGVSSLDIGVALAIHRHLSRVGAEHPSIRVNPGADAACDPSARVPFDGQRIPEVLQAYLTLGAKLLGPPAIDRDSKTVNWLVLLDLSDLDGSTYRSFFN